MKSVSVAIFAAALLETSAVAQEHSHILTNAIAITPSYIAMLTAEALTNAPVLRAASARADAAEHGAQAVRVWEDPTLKLGVLTASPRGFRESEEGNLLYGLEQKLPLWGKAKLARVAAEAGADVGRLNAELQFQQLRRDVTRNLFQAALADRVVETGERDLELLDTFAAIAEQRYRANQGSQVDVLRVQNERAKRAVQLQTERSRREHSHVTLNRLLGRASHTPWPLLVLPPPAKPIVFDERLLALALRGEPRLKVMRQEVKQAEATAAVTRRQRLPDIALGIEGRQYSADAGFREGLFAVSLNLPWFNRERYRSDRQRDEARTRAAREDAADFELGLRQELHHLTVEIDAARREALLYRDEFIPRSDQALASAQAAWASGRGMFNDVMEARRMLLEGRLMYDRAVAERQQSLAELALLCGLDDFNALAIGEVNNQPVPTPATKP
ncbi:MAG: TolC family protein [Verrucomicrobia bacterium]|nr:TolC family protein [Verrucomicrobiota bacterium]